MLSDAEWGRMALDIMHRTGLVPHGHDDEAVRWVAVRHAPDHIHVVAMLARQDGARPRHWNDFWWSPSGPPTEGEQNAAA